MTSPWVPTSNKHQTWTSRIRIGCAGRWLATSQLVMELPRAQVRLGILGLDLSIGIPPSNCDNWLAITCNYRFSIGFPMSSLHPFINNCNNWINRFSIPMLFHDFCMGFPHGFRFIPSSIGQTAVLSAFVAWWAAMQELTESAARGFEFALCLASGTRSSCLFAIFFAGLFEI